MPIRALGSPLSARRVVARSRMAVALSANVTLEDDPQRCGDRPIPTAAILGVREL